MCASDSLVRPCPSKYVLNTLCCTTTWSPTLTTPLYSNGRDSTTPILFTFSAYSIEVFIISFLSPTCFSVINFSLFKGETMNLSVIFNIKSDIIFYGYTIVFRYIFPMLYGFTICKIYFVKIFFWQYISNCSLLYFSVNFKWAWFVTNINHRLSVEYIYR